MLGSIIQNGQEPCTKKYGVQRINDSEIVL